MASANDTWEKKLQDPSATPVPLPLEFLKVITCNFSTERELGRGGYGVVYKGVLPSGKIIAVKKLLDRHLVEDNKFRNEVSSLMGTKHQNVVQFVGYCAETSWEAMTLQGSGKIIFAEIPARLLCFEYVSNASLDNYISDESSGLEWNMRYEIIKGICGGLHYLHEQCNIIHLDLKPENILLDAKMIPKIADFGLSRIFGEEQSRTITENRVGTRGYMAPEYSMQGVISTKADIFSLGVIIIEIVTGRKDYPLSVVPYFEIFNENESPQSNSTSVEHFKEKILHIWRNRLQKSEGDAVKLEQIWVCAELGIHCTEYNPGKRPVTQHIIDRLEEVNIMDGSIETGMSSTSAVAQVCSTILENMAQDQVPAVSIPASKTDIPTEDNSAQVDQREAAGTLRQLAKWPENRACIGESGGIPILVSLLSSTDVSTQVQVVTALLNLSIFEENKARLVSSGAVPRLLQVLEMGGSMEARENAADTLFILSSVHEYESIVSSVHEYQSIVGASRLIPPLVLTLSTGSQRLRKVTASVLSNLCIYHGNKSKAVRAGLVPILLELLTGTGNGVMDETLALLSILSSHPEGKAAISDGNVIPSLVRIIRNESPKNKENAAATLIHLWRNRLQKSQGDAVRLEQIRVCAELGIHCTEYNPGKRPVTQHIIDQLDEVNIMDGSIETGMSSTSAVAQVCSTISENMAQDQVSAISIPASKTDIPTEDNSAQVGSSSALAASCTASERDKVIELLLKLSSQNVLDQREAAGTLRQLAKWPENRACIGESGGIPILVSLLSSTDVSTQVQVVTALLNLSIFEENKARLVSSGAVPGLVQVLEMGGSMEARENAADTLFILSSVHEYQSIVGASGSIPPLVLLLSTGSQRGRKVAASALFNLCIYHGNKSKAVRAGLVPVLLELLTGTGNGVMDETLAILSILSSHPEGKAAISDGTVIPILVGIIRNESPKNKENAAATLIHLCNGEGEQQRQHLAEAQEHGLVSSLVELAECGTDREKKKAIKLLKLMNNNRST
ncbi:hypothetical protein ACQ4PT_001887 [Festuca glaucescens]